MTRRDLLQGRIPRARSESDSPGPAAPVTKQGRALPRLISWLDPEMAATPRRADPGRDGMPLLRPPGALAEREFVELCTRCGECARACPHDAIQEASAQLREVAGTPLIDPYRSPCRMCEGLPCISACEPGALRAEAAVAIGIARIQPLDCLNRLGSPCSVCVERCPVPDAITQPGDVPVVSEDLCTGCGICLHVCPAPGRAILLMPAPERPGRQALAAAGVTADLQQAEVAPEGSIGFDLPELREARLDLDTLDRFFADLAALTEILALQSKGSARSLGRTAPLTLAEARNRLLSGEIRGLQITYRHNGEVFCDTILPGIEGYKVVRTLAARRPRTVG